MKNIGFAEIADIEFTKPSTKLKRLMTGGYVDTDDKSISKSVRSDLSEVPVPEPTETELNSFYKDLFDHGRPTILSILPEYSDAYVSHQAEELSPPLSDLFQETFLTLSFSDLLVKCDETFQKLSITPQQAKNLEATTCTQSLSKTWFKYRTGRITTSKFKAAAHTDSSDPSPSLIKAICYPESLKINTAATKWGCMHEKDALKACDI